MRRLRRRLKQVCIARYCHGSRCCRLPPLLRRIRIDQQGQLLQHGIPLCRRLSARLPQRGGGGRQHPWGRRASARFPVPPWPTREQVQQAHREEGGQCCRGRLRAACSERGLPAGEPSRDAGTIADRWQWPIALEYAAATPLCHRRSAGMDGCGNPNGQLAHPLTCCLVRNKHVSAN